MNDNTDLPPSPQERGGGEVSKRKNMKKIIIITFIAAMSSHYVSAQADHEMSLNLGGGLSSLLYTPAKGSSNLGVGGEVGLGYILFLDNASAAETGTVVRAQWGIHTGLGIALYGARADAINESTVQKGIPDSDNGDLFDLHTTLKDYKETQSAIYLNIPLMALYDMEPFYFLAGFKFGIPISAKYKPGNATFTNEAYYPKYKNSLTGQEFAGLGKFERKNPDGNIDLGFTTMLSIEAGFKQRINWKHYIYVGVYFDYGLNNSLKKGSQQEFVNYKYSVEDPTGGFTTNSVMSSFCDKTNIIAAGLKLRLAMRMY